MGDNSVFPQLFCYQLFCITFSNIVYLKLSQLCLSCSVLMIILCLDFQINNNYYYYYYYYSTNVLQIIIIRLYVNTTDRVTCFYCGITLTGVGCHCMCNVEFNLITFQCSCPKSGYSRVFVFVPLRFLFFCEFVTIFLQSVSKLEAIQSMLYGVSVCPLLTSRCLLLNCQCCRVAVSLTFTPHFVLSYQRKRVWIPILFSRMFR